MTRVLHLIAVAALNAVPAVGWFIEDWSAGTTLTVYWFENVVACLFVSAQVLVHQRLSPRRGHFRYQAPSGERRSPQSSFVSGFLVTSLAFCAAHGIFLGVVLFLLSDHGERGLAAVDWRSVGIGCLYVLVVLIVDFLVDLPGLRNWPFRRVEQTAYRGLGRIVVVHLTLIFGLFAVAVTGASSALFSVFIVLKTLYSLATVLPRWEPTAPPEWLSRTMNRMPNVRPGTKFEDEWADDQADEAKRREKNEQPWVDKRR
jgi:hypothetical protein